MLGIASPLHGVTNDYKTDKTGIVQLNRIADWSKSATIQLVHPNLL